MRIAILIGISKYQNYDNLPGCENDIKAIEDVLKTSKEFNEIKVYPNSVNSDVLKEDLSKFFSDLKGKDVSEVFFYFSGHGNFFNNEFYYILSDFDETKRRQTSLQNLEIDTMIKSVNPKMVSKVVDACQSGISYIKGNNNIVEKYYSKTTESFEKCYFLHSSMSNQYSYQNDELSDFTRSFLNSLQTSTKPLIRYKDIIDYISDEFERSAEQTPFFVTQADHTEPFLTISEDVKSVLAKYIKKSSRNDRSSEEKVNYTSYLEKIRKDAEIYSSKEETDKLLQKIKDIIEKTPLVSELSELYSLKPTFEYYLDSLPNRQIVGRWLQENKHDFFAKPEHESTPYEEEVLNPFGGIASLLGQTKKITKYKNVLVGFEQSLELQYTYLIIDFIPIYPNLSQYGLILTFLISKKEIKFFYSLTDYTDTDWTNKKINLGFKWQSADFLIKESKKIEKFIEDILNDNQIFILTTVKKKFEV